MQVSPPLSADDRNYNWLPSCNFLPYKKCNSFYSPSSERRDSFLSYKILFQSTCKFSVATLIKDINYAPKSKRKLIHSYLRYGMSHSYAFFNIFRIFYFFGREKFERKGMLKQQLRIKPFVVCTKIQEANPVHSSNLINKELGYDTLVERGDEMSNVKIKNCICSARANSELFKRFSRNFIANIKNQIDQLIIFTSVNPQSRLETSIGLQTNPGIFLIVGLTFLDEKYKQPYHKCEIEFSFLEFREGQMYDLLCYTEKPLQPQLESSTQKFINFNEHWVKTTTFNQFIKYFKIALFNNKDRDFKTDNRDNKCRSTFIMKVRSKIFNYDNEMTKEHTTILMDYEPNCQKENLLNAKEKSAKNIMEYFLIEINNSNPSNKHIHYHLVEQNYLLLLLKKFLPKIPEGKDEKRPKEPIAASQIMFIHSFPAQKEAFEQGYAYLQNTLNYLNDEWQIKVQPRQKKNIKFNHQFVKNHLKSISNGVSINTYNSLRSFNAFKQYLSSEIKKNRLVIKEFKKIITQFLKEKLEMQFLKNQIIAYQFKLIGGCIKSDHFKDFYNAKSYLQLGREIKIKTQTVKEEILEKWEKIEEVGKKFQALQKKEGDGQAKNKEHAAQSEFIPYQTLNFNSTSSNSLNHTKHASWAGTALTKFKKIGVFKGQQCQKDEMRNLTLYIYEYISNVWDIVSLTDQRTVCMSINLQQEINNEEEQLNALMTQFSEDIGGINETDIMYQQENNHYNNNEIALFRSLNFLGMLGPKKKVGDLQIGKRIMMKENQNFSTQKAMPKEKRKLPAITSKNIVITGDIKISEMLSNPNEQNGKSFVQSMIIASSENF